MSRCANRAAAWTIAGVGLLGLMVPSALAQDCAWRPWAAPWGSYNIGPDLFPDNDIHNPTNWDFSLSQDTVYNAPKTPNSGSGALHWFLDAQPPQTTSNKIGSGGVYQEITVTPGVQIKYSFAWRGHADSNVAWFEFLLIDGPFSVADADQAAANWIMQKRELTGSGSFGWQTLTHTSTVYAGDNGPTITPTNSTVTVVLKAGRAATAGAMESFFDDVVVYQTTPAENLIVNGDFEDGGQQAPCDDELMFQDNTNYSNYWVALTDCPEPQHTVTTLTPSTGTNDGLAEILVEGTGLDQVDTWTLRRVDGFQELDPAVPPVVDTIPTEPTVTVTFDLTGVTEGDWELLSSQDPDPPCLTVLTPFTVTCPNPTTLTSLTPDTQTDPTGPGATPFEIAGTQLDVVSTVSLVSSEGTTPAVTIEDATPSYDSQSGNIDSFFDISCIPAGRYDLLATRDDGCLVPALEDALRVIKTPLPGGCDWEPWATDDTELALGDDLDPPNGEYNATNWDYQNMDTPSGSGQALRWWLDMEGNGNGGVFQEITVQAGVPLEYSMSWKAEASDGPAWIEFLLIDGPFELGLADQLQETSTLANPAMIRKIELDDDSFAWNTLTHTSPAHTGPAGPRPQTITPTGTTVTVVLKAGRGTGGTITSYWDDISVSQGGGAERVSFGDFENGTMTGLCVNTIIHQDECELDTWRRSAFEVLDCPKPFADADEDRDVDGDDFGLLQACITGDGNAPGALPVAEGCECFDRPEPVAPDGDIDLLDVAAFEKCATGPGVELDPDDPGTWPVDCQ